jgi:hypothetical protein
VNVVATAGVAQLSKLRSKKYASWKLAPHPIHYLGNRPHSARTPNMVGASDSSPSPLPFTRGEETGEGLRDKYRLGVATIE